MLTNQDLTALILTVVDGGLRTFVRTMLLLVCAASLSSSTALAQVTVNAGSGAGSFQCQEGAAPSAPGSSQDILWCDTSHWMMMMSNTTQTPTAILGATGSDADNTILISAVDATPNFNPSFLTVSGAPTTKVTLNGATTNFVAFIDGQRVIVTTNLQSTANLANSNLNFVYLTKDATTVAATTFAPVYGRTQPTCSITATPQFWFNTATRKMGSCASNAGSYTINPVLFLGVIALDSGGVSLGIAHEPWHLSPYTRVREFGNGADGLNSVTGTVTHDGWKQYSALEITSGGNLQHTAIVSGTAPGLFAYSQNPVLIVGTGKIDLAQLGGLGGAAITTPAAAGKPGVACGWGGGGGGGGSTTTSPGGNGAGRSQFFASQQLGGGTGSQLNANNALAGQSPSNPPPLNGQPLLGGCGGGSGAGDGSNNSGAGGKGGGGIYLKAPSVIIGASALIDADGGQGASGATAAEGAGGGGGGGVIIIDTWFEESSITITAAAGTTGATGRAGASGGTGIIQVIQKQ